MDIVNTAIKYNYNLGWINFNLGSLILKPHISFYPHNQTFVTSPTSDDWKPFRTDEWQGDDGVLQGALNVTESLDQQEHVQSTHDTWRCEQENQSNEHSIFIEDL